MEGKTITQKEQKDILYYCPKTGIFTWKERLVSRFASAKAAKIWRTRFLGKAAGSFHGGGYQQINIGGEVYLAHRLAWLYVRGAFPVFNIDHINGIRHDNRFTNLRDVPQEENNRNTKKPKVNTSGCVGVYWDKILNKWRAKITAHGHQYHLGLFRRFSDAVQARKLAEREYGFHENHGR